MDWVLESFSNLKDSVIVRGSGEPSPGHLEPAWLAVGVNACIVRTPCDLSACCLVHNTSGEGTGVLAAARELPSSDRKDLSNAMPHGWEKPVLAVCEEGSGGSASVEVFAKRDGGTSAYKTSSEVHDAANHEASVPFIYSAPAIKKSHQRTTQDLNFAV